MPTRKSCTSTILTSQPQFTYQLYQGQYQFGHTTHNPTYQYQLYPGYTYQIPQQPQFGLVNTGFTIANVHPILGYPRYPHLGIGFITQGYQDPSCRLPFIATSDLPNISRLKNDPIFYLPYWPPMPNNFPNDIPKFEGKSGEDPSNHVMTYHLWCASNSLIDDSIRLHIF